LAILNYQSFLKTPADGWWGFLRFHPYLTISNYVNKFSIGSVLFFVDPTYSGQICRVHYAVQEITMAAKALPTFLQLGSYDFNSSCPETCTYPNPHP